MQTWDAIRARRNVRDYDARPIPAEDLDQILEAARRTPSSQNKQRWDIVVVTERDRLVELAKVWQAAEHVASSAATLALVAPVDGGPTASVHYDLGQLTIQAMLAATDLGIGSAHAAVGDQELARQLLDLPADRELVWLIALGYPAGDELTPLSDPDRRPFHDVVHREQW